MASFAGVLIVFILSPGRGDCKAKKSAKAAGQLADGSVRGEWRLCKHGGSYVYLYLSAHTIKPNQEQAHRHRDGIGERIGLPLDAADGGHQQERQQYNAQGGQYE